MWSIRKFLNALSLWSKARMDSPETPSMVTRRISESPFGFVYRKTIACPPRWFLGAF